MKSSLLWIFLVFLLLGCRETFTVDPAVKDQELISYVNPFIGTGGHGHTYPGATMPFGMIQLSPDTRLEGWDGCSGYHYSDRYIYGFSHTHLSGTGVSDYGDILLMPTDRVIFNNGSDGEPGYRAAFSHDREVAEPGYYSVFLDSTEIEVELTVSERSGIHRYVFPKGKPQVVILDLVHRDEVLDSKVEIVSDTELNGYRHSKAWATNQMLFYNIQLSRPFKEIAFSGQEHGKEVQAALIFDQAEVQEIEVRIGISPVDETGAKQNRLEELGDKNFDLIKTRAQSS